MLNTYQWHVKLYHALDPKWTANPDNRYLDDQVIYYTCTYILALAMQERKISSKVMEIEK